MRVALNLVIDLNEGEWSSTFGVESASGVRADVKEYLEGLIRDAAIWNEVDATVTLRN